MEENLKFDETWCEELVRSALEEDIGSGDATSRAVVSSDMDITASLIAGEEGVLAGLPVAAMVFSQVDDSIVFQSLVDEGAGIVPGQRLAVIQGPARSILEGERTALNFLQQLSGVATLASRFAEAASRHGVRVKDTRKTVPGWRALQKYAVRVGGCDNHRAGLYDQILIKENHLRCLPGEGADAVRDAVGAAKEKCPDLEVEVEVENLEEFRAAVDAGADIVMLDNFDPQAVKEAVDEVKEADKRPVIEVSGNVSLETIEDFAMAGPDWISVGRITHSAKALDMSIEVEK